MATGTWREPPHSLAWSGLHSSFLPHPAALEVNYTVKSFLLLGVGRKINRNPQPAWLPGCKELAAGPCSQLRAARMLLSTVPPACSNPALAGAVWSLAPWQCLLLTLLCWLLWVLFFFLHFFGWREGNVACFCLRWGARVQVVAQARWHRAGQSFGLANSFGATGSCSKTT